MQGQTASAGKNGVLLPMGMAFAGFALWAVSDAAIRVIRDTPSVLIAFIEAVFSLALLLALSPLLGGLREAIARPRLALRVLRGLVISGSSYLSIVAFSRLELADAYAVIFITPVLAKLLSVLLAGERIAPASWMATLAGFAGVLIVLRPGAAAMDLGTAAALGTAFCFALGYVMTRAIGEAHQTLLSITLFQYVFLGLGTALPAWSLLGQATPRDLAVVVLISLLSISGSILVARAYARAPAASVAPVHYSQMLWGVAFGAALFGEYPDGWTLAGAGVIIAAGIWLVRLGQRVPAS